MNAREKLIKEIPKDEDFRAIDVVDILYPELVRQDTEGRLFNRGTATVTRMLRQLRGVVEIKTGIFYAASEFFTIQK